MSIYIHTISAKTSLKWLEEGFETYARRLQGIWSLKAVNTPLRNHSNPKNMEAERFKESQGLLSQVPTQAHVIALDETGKQQPSLSFAKSLNQTLETFRDVHFIIGGPEGLTQALRDRANVSWSISQLTFPHTLAKVILAEQIYRAWSIIHNHPYHNE